MKPTPIIKYCKEVSAMGLLYLLNLGYSSLGFTSTNEPPMAFAGSVLKQVAYIHAFYRKSPKKA